MKPRIVKCNRDVFRQWVVLTYKSIAYFPTWRTALEWALTQGQHRFED